MKALRYPLFFLAASVLPLYFVFALSRNTNTVRGHTLGYLAVFILATAVNFLTKQPIYSKAIRISYLTFHWFTTLLLLRFLVVPVGLLYIAHFLRPINAILLIAIPWLLIQMGLLKLFVDYEQRSTNNMLEW